jgi:hypothetical protein
MSRVITGKPFDENLRLLYQRLLTLADKEDQAITANNLGELEACIRRKKEIFQRIREFETNKVRGSSEVGPELAELIVLVAERHEHIKERIRAMLGECRQAILEIQSGRRAHRAYYCARKQRPEGPGRLF